MEATYLDLEKIEIDGVLQPNGDRVVSFLKMNQLLEHSSSGYMFILNRFYSIEL